MIIDLIMQRVIIKQTEGNTAKKTIAPKIYAKSFVQQNNPTIEDKIQKMILRISSLSLLTQYNRIALIIVNVINSKIFKDPKMNPPRSKR